MTEQKGQLVRWNDARGCGFIKPEVGSEEVFIHIKTLSKMARPPVIGDIIYFQSITDEQGKERAYSARIEGVGIKSSTASAQVKARPVRVSKARTANRGSSRSFNSLGLIAVILAVVYFFPRNEAANQPINESKPAISETVLNQVPLLNQFENDDEFSCQGKVHCSEMISCKEARFYLRNCPGVKIDGDHDGIPCERMCR